jgi:hypothetical protein
MQAGPLLGLGRGEDRSHPPRQAGHLLQREREAVIGQLVVTPPLELAACGHGAHLVVQLGPTGLAAAVAEPNEGDRVRGRDVGCLRRLLHRRSTIRRSLGHTNTTLQKEPMMADDGVVPNLR